MKKALSKAINNTNVHGVGVFTSPLFDVDQIRKTIANSVQMYIDQKPMIEKMISQQAPLISEMTKQLNESAKMYHSMFESLDMSRILTEAQEQHKKMQEAVVEVIKMMPINFGSFGLGVATLSPHKQEEIKEKIEEEIFEEVIEKVEERSEKIAPLEFKASLVALPPNARWEDIKIVFKNRNDVKIYHKRKCLVDTNCEKLRFAKNNTTYKLPNKPWELLRCIAIINDQKMDKAKPTVRNLMHMLEIKKPNALHRVKSRLDKNLERAFGINEPFSPYKEYKYYKPNFTLVSEPGTRNIQDLWSSGRGLPKKYL